MTCPNPACGKDAALDAFFCQWCSVYLAVPAKGAKANLFARWLALALDPLIGWVSYLFAIAVFGTVSSSLGWLMAFLFPVVYAIWFLSLLRQGMTPGKKLLGLQVVEQNTGNIPGFGKMFLREIVGRILSGLIFGLGYLWALIDKNGQAWHDKLAGTVVVKRA
jgi:uncharacterized RDD family membrane protein YckC